MREKSPIRICDVTGIRYEITVRNVVFGGLRLARRTRPTRLGGTSRPTVHTSLHDFPMAGLLVALATNDLQSDQSGNRSSDCIFCEIKLYR